MRTRPFVPAKLKTAMRTIAKYVKPRETVDTWLDAPDDSLIPYFAPVLELLTQEDAELIQPRAEGQTARILAKRSYGQKLTAKDFVLRQPRQERSDAAEEDSNEVAGGDSDASDSD
jgi:hypothetical protein